MQRLFQNEFRYIFLIRWQYPQENRLSVWFLFYYYYEYHLLFQYTDRCKLSQIWNMMFESGVKNLKFTTLLTNYLFSCEPNQKYKGEKSLSWFCRITPWNAYTNLPASIMKTLFFYFYHHFQKILWHTLWFEPLLMTKYIYGSTKVWKKDWQRKKGDLGIVIGLSRLCG